MSESERVQRWRQRQRQAGKEPLTIWLTTAEKLHLEDMALTRHCSPSELIQQALAHLRGESLPVTDAVTDTEQLRSVTDTVADTMRQELPLLVRLIVEELQLQSALPVTDTVTDTILKGVTDTVTAMRTSPLSHAGNIDVTATVTDTQSIVTFTVTDTEEAIEAADITAAVADTSPVPSADYKKETALERVTDTVTDTTTAPPPKRKAPARQRAVTDTVAVTYPVLEPFDTTRFYLGKLCPKHHEWGGTGQSLLRKHNQRCRECENEGRREGRAKKRQGQAPEQRPGGALPDTVPPYDPTTRRLGKLCPRGHDYHGTGQSLRTTHKSGYCLACNAERVRERRQTTAL